MTIDHAIEHLRRNGITGRGSGATADEIAAAERRLGTMFPEAYRRFLSHFGYLSVGHIETYGLGVSVPSHLDLVRNTECERSEFEPHLPVWLIPVMNDGGGNHYCLDTSHVIDGDCPVVFWDHEAGIRQSPRTVGDSFCSWLIRYLRDEAGVLPE